MLSPKIVRFIDELKQLGSIGCLTVPRAHLYKVKQDFSAADQILSAEPDPERLRYIFLSPEDPLPQISGPLLLVITEEHYSQDPAWAEQLRNLAEYFENFQYTVQDS